MRSISATVLLAFVTPRHAYDAMDKLVDRAHASMDKLVDKLVNNLFDGPLQVLPHYHAELDHATLGKPGHLRTTSGTSLRPVSPLRVHPRHSPVFASARSSYAPQFCKDATTGHYIQPVVTNLKVQEGATRVAEQMKVMLDDPNVQEQMKPIADQMKATMADPNVQQHMKRFAGQVNAMMANVQEQGKLAGEQIKKMIADPNFQEQVKPMAEQMKAAIADPSIQEHTKRTAEQMKAMMADPNVQEPAKLMTEQMRVYMADPNVQKHAKSFAEQMKVTMANPNIQDYTQRFSEQMQSLALTFQEQEKQAAEQMKKMMTTSNIQEPVKHVAQQMKAQISKPNFQKHVKRITEQIKMLNPGAAGSLPKVSEQQNRFGKSLPVMTAAVAAAFALFPSTAFASDIVNSAQPFADFAFADQAGNLAGTFFGASLFPYLAFLYFLRQDANGLSPVAKGGFTFLLGFVFGTIICSIVSTKTFGLSLANVDWLHADAEQLLCFTNILDVVGLKLTLDGFTSGTLTQPAKPEQPRGGVDEKIVVGATAAIAGAAIAATYFASGGDLAAHTPYLGGVGNLPAGQLPFSEPDNALSIPTWAVHVSSLLEWLVAQGLVWRIALASGNPAWKGMTWAMIPSHSSGITACTYHIFYNKIQDLVLLQSILTFVGNSVLAIAAYRIAASNGWKFSLPFGDEKKESTETADAAPSLALEAPIPVDKDVGSTASLATIFAYTLLGSYVIKYGGAVLPVTTDAPEWLAFLVIAAPTAFNVYKWDERSKTGTDFNGPI